jgi:hypothetical protein
MSDIQHIYLFKRLLLCDKMMLMMTMLTLLVAPMLLFQSTGGQALKSALFRRTSNISATNFSVHTLQNLLLFISKSIYTFLKKEIYLESPFKLANLYHSMNITPSPKHGWAQTD